MKLRVGLVGLGAAWEARHRPALLALSDRFEVRAVCEEVFARAQQVAGDFQAESIDGYRVLTQRDDVDAILMLSPQWFGPLPILAACDAGKAVYCAATMDLGFDEARHIKERVEGAGIAFMAEFPRRQAPATLRLKELIATHLGPPQLLFCHRRLILGGSNGRAPLGRWKTSPATRDLLELVDWCRYVAGCDATSVLGVAYPGFESSDFDYQMMSLDFSPQDQAGKGPLAQISCGHYIPSQWKEANSFRPPAALQVRCEKGIAFIDLPSNLVWFDSAGRHQESLETERPVGEQLLSQFHRAVTSLVRRTSDLEDAYKALSIINAARKSVAESRRVSIEC